MFICLEMIQRHVQLLKSQNQFKLGPKILLMLIFICCVLIVTKIYANLLNERCCMSYVQSVSARSLSSFSSSHFDLLCTHFQLILLSICNCWKLVSTVLAVLVVRVTKNLLNKRIAHFHTTLLFILSLNFLWWSNDKCVFFHNILIE